MSSVAADDQQQRDDEHEDAQPGYRNRSDHQRGIRERRDDRLGHAAPDQELGVLHHDPAADHHQHHGVDVGAAHRPQQRDLDQRAEQRAGDDGNHQPEEEIEPERGGDEIDGVGAEGVELAVGEIHHPHDAENQRQADAEQRVGSAEDDGVHEVLEELVHEPVTVLSRACSQAWRGPAALRAVRETEPPGRPRRLVTERGQAFGRTTLPFSILIR